MRTGPGRGIVTYYIDTAGRLVAVEILLRVRRGAGDRLDGSACISGGTDVRTFSGMLELMRVFEELIPEHDERMDAGVGDPPPDAPRAHTR